MADFTEHEEIKDSDLKTSKEWLIGLKENMNIVIMDPDGWDRTNYHYSFYEEKITFAEFNSRLHRSTVLKKCDGKGKR